VWAYYDKCSAQTQSFIVMAECGKEARNAECIPKNTCSSESTTFVQFSDALVLSVKNKGMTEAEAMRRYAEYKTTMQGGITFCWPLPRWRFNASINAACVRDSLFA
jgi:hypothetical protein